MDREKEIEEIQVVASEGILKHSEAAREELSDYQRNEETRKFLNYLKNILYCKIYDRIDSISFRATHFAEFISSLGSSQRISNSAINPLDSKGDFRSGFDRAKL